MAVRPVADHPGTRRYQQTTASYFRLGSFVTAKLSPGDLDILLIMSDDFEVEQMPAPAQVVFDSTRAKLLFESNVFWARASIGQEMLNLWLDTYQTSRRF